MLPLLRKLMSVAAFPVVLIACEDDVVEPDDELTETEAVALLKGTGGLLWANEPTTLSEDSVVVTCAQGGSATAHGKRPDEEFVGDTIRLVVDYQITPSGCKVTGDGMQFTIDGDPRFRYYLFIEAVESSGELDIAGSLSGGVKWRLKDRSGSCSMDLALVDPQVVGDAITGFFVGKICGYEVKVDGKGILPPDA